MNKRIRELAEQANSHHDNFFDLNYKELDVFLEKFAELIVQECMEVCQDQETYDPIVLPYKPSKQFADAIKQHFGVEE